MHTELQKVISLTTYNLGMMILTGSSDAHAHDVSSCDASTLSFVPTQKKWISTLTTLSKISAKTTK